MVYYKSRETKTVYGGLIMKNLHFAIICSYNCIKHFNELEELTEEQRDLLIDFEYNALSIIWIFSPGVTERVQTSLPWSIVKFLTDETKSGCAS